MKYVLGVDGGNTKTDYMLFDDSGKLVRHIRKGTISHEALAGSYPESERLIKAHMQELLDGLGIGIPDVSASAMGLAGLDLPSQYVGMNEVLDRLGFRNYAAANDGFLGLKAASSSGIGVCSINGTGNVVVGIDAKANQLQVGGLGFTYGDIGGGWDLARSVIRKVYDYFYRLGAYTAMADPMCALFGIANKSDYMSTTMLRFCREDITDRPVNEILFKAADEGDAVAIELLEYFGSQMAHSAAGCATNLEFEGELELVMAGSMWAKPESKVMPNAFKREFARLYTNPTTFVVLNLPPVCGAVLWSLELLDGKFPSDALKAKVLSEIESLNL